MTRGDGSRAAATAGPVSTLSYAFNALQSSAQGLGSAEAGERLRRDGLNTVGHETGTHPVAILINQFRSPLMVVLLLAALITAIVGEATEALIIAAIVLASSALGFYQELRASAAVAKLRARLSVSAKVIRDGQVISVPAEQIVRGDVLELGAGSLIPADAIVISTDEMQADEAALTGESFPAPKLAAPVDGALADSMRLHMGTSIRSGMGRALVVETGRRTQFGIIIGEVARRAPETSFAKGVRSFSVLMTQIMLLMLALVLPINLLLGKPLLESLLFSTALAIGLTPELLPAIVTVTLARGAQQLAGAGVLIRRLSSIEDIGAMNVLCVDKTGTLTQGRVTLDRAVDPSGAVSEPVAQLGVLNARLQTGSPNPLDQALASAGSGMDLTRYSHVAEVPYDFERKRLSVLVRDGATYTLVCKGATASVLSVCSGVLLNGEPHALDGRLRADQDEKMSAWGAAGYRVLAVATKDLGPRTACSRDDETALLLAGYLLFDDPLKSDIADITADLARAGIRLKIITGDNRYVASRVASATGVAAGNMLTGEEIGELTDRGLLRKAVATDLFVEVTPDQKQRIVRALKSPNRVVGYMGDGINDAPALRTADVGISVANAVDAAKEAADVVLLLPDLRVLLDGVLIGRQAFANTIKYITITTSANIGNMISMAIASLFLPFLPLLAKQILFNNLLSDIPLLAISTDRVDDDVVSRPGTWNFGRLLRSMLAFGILSSLFDGIAIAVLLIGFHANEPLFQSGWFIFSLATEIAVVGAMRTGKPFYASAPSPLLAALSAVVLIIGATVPFVSGASAALSLVPPSPPLLAILTLLLLLYVAATEVLKRIFQERSTRNRNLRVNMAHQ